MTNCPACSAALYFGRSVCRRHRMAPDKPVRFCSMPGCPKAFHARDLCLRHYMQRWRTQTHQGKAV